MPLSHKGKSILAEMVEHYKSKKKAKNVFYAMINSGKLKGVEKHK